VFVPDSKVKYLIKNTYLKSGGVMKSQFKTCICLFLITFTFPLAQNTSFAKSIFVDDLNDGKTGSGKADDPFRDLQNAIDLAEDGDTIIINPGEYLSHPEKYAEKLCGNCEDHQTEVSATRGFYIHDKSLSLIGKDPEKTVLITQAGYGVLFENSLGSLIKDLKITGGKRDPDGNATDAAIVAKWSRVTIKNVKIVGNTHQVDGVVVGIGGVFGRENSELFIIGNLIQDNGWDGVALYRGATAYIADNLISKGRGAGVGITWDGVAAVYRNKISGYWKGIGTFGDSRAVVRNNCVFDNLGWGIIATGTSFLDASNNLIYNNGNCGFAVWKKDAKGRCTNNIISKNGWRKEWVCPQVGMWMAEENKNFEISYNDVWNNQEGNYRDMPDFTGENGNLSVDPKFENTEDFKLKKDSPLLDSGNPLLTDPDGTPSDIGLYGGPESRKDNK